MTLPSRSEFDIVYQSAVDDVLRYWTPDMQSEIARHNMGWETGATDFEDYLRRSSIRFYRALTALGLPCDVEVCDVGGFWGVWPLTLVRLGVPQAAMTEALRYYSESFTPLFDYLRSQGVTVIDFDPFEPGARVPGQFDRLTLMAVLEHYPHSLAAPIETIKQMARRGAQLYIDVPNIAYWPKRTAMLRGRSPLVSVAQIYRSDVPFIGHHHEFTRAELRELCALSGLDITGEWAFCYSGSRTTAGRIVEKLQHPVSSLAFVLSGEAREVLAVRCEVSRGRS